METTNELAHEEEGIKTETMRLWRMPAVPEQVLLPGIISEAHNPRSALWRMPAVPEQVLLPGITEGNPLHV